MYTKNQAMRLERGESSCGTGHRVIVRVYPRPEFDWFYCVEKRTASKVVGIRESHEKQNSLLLHA